MSQEMPESDFKRLSEEECRDLGLLLKYEDGRMAIFDTGLYDYWENKKNKTGFIIEVDLEYLPGLHERDDDYPFALEVMTIVPEIIGEKQHKLRAKYFGARAHTAENWSARYLRRSTK